jgi:hypothetical protein
MRQVMVAFVLGQHLRVIEGQAVEGSRFGQLVLLESAKVKNMCSEVVQ